ncbi:MAG: magnesium/cobalt transporter CorA [Candidatus Cyclobacteriaceae bacterium M2_1C_046]
MINYITLENGIHTKRSGSEFPDITKIIWVDLINASYEERKLIEETFNIELFTQQESEEIESSSKYLEMEEEIGINMNFLKQKDHSYTKEPVSFILKNKILFTQRSEEYKSFTDTYRTFKTTKPADGDDVFLNILESRIDFDADLIESITDKITTISKELVKDQDLSRKVLLDIANLQETTISLRENIVEKQRILSSILKSKMYPKEDLEKMRVMFQDVNSLLDHVAFNFERLEFLQNTFLGLVDMEQNRVIKIFTVVTVIFMPPTLIASMYGMNFEFMPELDEAWGYPFAILLMITSSALTLLFFRRKKWL